MVFDIVILRLYHNKTLHESRYNHRKMTEYDTRYEATQLTARHYNSTMYCSQF